METATIILLGVAVFGASLLQAATGIGYGVIAGPIFLVALNGNEAFQISTLHNLAIAALLFPLVRQGVDYALLRLLIIGSSVGIIIGFTVQLSVDLSVLKLASGAMIAFVAGSLIHNMARKNSGPASRPHSASEAGFIGAVAGVMGGMLAMPGPLAATWMSIRGYSKQEIRATILAFFVFAYGANAALYFIATGFPGTVLKLALGLSIPLTAGIFAGNALAKHLSETAFRRILLVVLLATIGLLLTDGLVA